MGAFVSGLALALVAVNYGWVPASSDAEGAEKPSDGYEYVVQLDAEELRALAEGRVDELSSAPPAELRRIDRVKVVVGDQPPPRELTAVDRDSPRRIAAGDGPVRQTVAKPVTPDWLPSRDETPSDPQSRTSYQNPQGNVFTDAAQDLGQATRQTGKDLRDGTVGFFGGLRDATTAAVDGTANALNNTVNIGNDDYYNQRQPAAAAPQSNGQRGYVPFSYENPTPAQPTPALSTTAQSQTPAPTPAPGQFSQASPTQAQFTTPSGTNDQYRGGQSGPALQQPAPTNGGGDIATRFGAGSNQTPFPRNEDADLVPVERSRTNAQFVDSQQGFSQNPGNSIDNPRSGYPPTGDDSYRRGATPRQTPSREPWDNWDRGGATSARSNPAPPLSTPDFGAPASQAPPQQPPFQSNQGAGQTVGFGDRTGGSGQANPDVSSWAQSRPPVQTTNAAQQSSEEAAPVNPWQDATWLVLLAVSLAGNLYVVTGYLDVRNKYRAALRRLPVGVQERLAA